MAKIQKRVHGPATVSNAAATKYTVPANCKAKRLRVHVQNPSGLAIALTVSIGADAAGVRLLDAYSIPAAAAGVTGNVIDFYWDHVLEETEIIQAFTGGAGGILVMTISVDEETLG